MQTLMITGGSGFIGSALVRHLLAHTNCRIVNIDKLSYAANPNTLADLVDQPNYIFEQFDINDKTRLEAAFTRYQPQAVFHLAAESHVDNSIHSATPFIESNIHGTFQLLEASRCYWQRLPAEQASLFRLIHISTDEVYGSLNNSDGVFHENSPYAPSSPYAASKAASDHLVAAWQHTYGLPAMITHCTNNYGPYQFPEKLIPHSIIRMLNHEAVPIYGNGLNQRDWLHVADHVAALMLVWQKGEIGVVYNIGAHNEVSNLDMVQRIATILSDIKPSTQGKYEELITFVADRPGHDLRYAVNTERIKSLGWKPQYTFEQGLRETVSWYIEHTEWWLPMLTRVQNSHKTSPDRKKA